MPINPACNSSLLTHYHPSPYHHCWPTRVLRGTRACENDATCAAEDNLLIRTKTDSKYPSKCRFSGRACTPPPTHRDDTDNRERHAKVLRMGRLVQHRVPHLEFRRTPRRTCTMLRSRFSSCLYPIRASSASSASVDAPWRGSFSSSLPAIGLWERGEKIMREIEPRGCYITRFHHDARSIRVDNARFAVETGIE